MTKLMTSIQRPWGSARTYQQLAAAFCIVVLSACGGSSGTGAAPDSGEPGNPTDPIQTGNGGTPDPTVTDPGVPDNDEGTDLVGDTSDPTQCNAATQKQWAYESMQDFYLFYDQVPVVDPQSFDSADDVVRNVRFQERDDFSRVDDAEVSSLAFDEGREFGLGFRWGPDNEGMPRILLTISESPFGLAGIERGDIILTADGLDWADPVLRDTFFERLIGTPEEPATASWRFQKRDTGEIVEVDITATEFRINTVLSAAIYSGGALPGNVGYLAFNQFLNPSSFELNGVFTQFREQSISELVLDLRYNGGGRVSIARELASLIAGDSNAGETIYNYRFNDKYTEENFTLTLQSDVGDLGLSRLIVLTTGNSASASEIVIAGLQPHMEVVTIGTRTTGKPYIQYAYDRCGERLAVIEAEGFNANNVSVFGGIPATCFAVDDRTQNFGLNDGEFEGFLRAGIDFIENGTCAVAPMLATDTLRQRAVTKVDIDDRQGMSFRGGSLAD
ncbi:MAG: S41 family peptidase [Granulosicoccus sp.]